ncbi:GDYXXLXY domain-containing protein [Haliangium sp.]|uniref:GDYXXLXY domain-containing protein n=1 Tax=Haliangium sp. TaxID=2663208 RepID=UPI003D131848
MESSRPPAVSLTWTHFARSRLLVCGVCLVAAGAIFFVAANWSRLAPLTRMGLCAGAMSAALVAGGWLGLSSLAGRVSVLLAGLLFGPLVAIYGQTYQTGADAWELFALWAVVLTGHLALTRFVVTGAVWLLMVHAAVFLWGDQTLTGDLVTGGQALALTALAGFDVALAVAATRFLPGRDGALLVRAAASVAAFLVTAVAISVLARFEIEAAQVPAMLLMGAGWAVLWARYRERHPDLYMLFVLACSVLTAVGTALGYLVFEVFELDDFGLWVMGALVCAEVWLLARWLLYWRFRHHPADEAAAATAAAEPPAAAAPETPDGRPAPARSELDDAPWFMRAFVAVGTWVGALLVGAALVAAEVYEVVPVGILLGLALLVAAGWIGRRWAGSLLGGQLAWVFVAGGQMLIVAVVFEVRAGEEVAAVVAVVLQLGCSAWITIRSLRAACMGAAVVALSLLALALDQPWLQELLLAAVAVVVAALWVFADRLQRGRLRAPWAAAIYALPIGLCFPLVVLLLLGEKNADVGATPWLADLALAGVALAVIRVAAREADARSQRGPIAAMLGALALAAATYPAPGVVFGAILVALSHLRRRRALEVIGFILLGGFISGFYYQLSLGLLLKSVSVLGAGVVLLLGVAALDWASSDRLTRARLIDVGARRRDLGRAAVLMFVCLAIPAGLVVHKERILAAGRLVYLDLRPRDPRSLMQGDYMVLRYALEDQVLDSRPEPGPGVLIVSLDQHGVGRFAHLDDGTPPASDQIPLRFRYIPGGSIEVRVGAESYFFEEGTADRYQAARYGVLAVDGRGRSVLVGLADADRQPLGPVRTDRVATPE